VLTFNLFFIISICFVLFFVAIIRHLYRNTAPMTLIICHGSDDTTALVYTSYIYTYMYIIYIILYYIRVGIYDVHLNCCSGTLRHIYTYPSRAWASIYIILFPTPIIKKIYIYILLRTETVLYTFIRPTAESEETRTQVRYY